VLEPAGAECIIARYRSADKNLRTPLIRTIRRAGLEPWPKLFHNLRATRQPELEESFPSHVVCAWIGNSEKVARKHYLQVTVGQFAKAVHNPVHYTSTQAHAAPHAGGTESKDNSDIRGDVALCGATCSETMGDEGLEPPTSTV
jgi:hypothetical protein